MRASFSSMSGILQASEVPPAIGQVTVAEVECRFLVRDANEESNLAAVSMVMLILPHRSRDIIIYLYM